MIRLHHAPQTRSMRSLWLLHELGVDFELALQPFDKSLRSAEYLQINPAGRVPALEIDGATMFETGAITEYLCERFPDIGLGRMPGHPERRDWLVWVHFSETISQHTAALTQQHVALYEDHMRSAILTQLEPRRLAKCYAALEGHLSAKVPAKVSDSVPDGCAYLLPSGFSAADISVGQAVYMARHFAAIEGFPALSNWYANLTVRPAFQASLPGPGDARLYAQDFYPALP